MAIDDFDGKPVVGGTWWYDGSVAMRVFIVACNFDRSHEWASDEVEHVRECHGYEIEGPGDPRPMGPDGVLYHLENTSCPDYETVAEVKAWATAQAWGPITWDE